MSHSPLKRESSKRTAVRRAIETAPPEIPKAQLPKKRETDGDVEVLDAKLSPRLVFKHGNKFLVVDKSGMIPASSPAGYGYYTGDTRHLSLWDITLNSQRLTCISSTVDNGFAGTLYYSCPTLPQQKFLIKREILLGTHLSERLTLINGSNRAVNCDLTLHSEADFHDIFEICGWNRVARGRHFGSITNKNRDRIVHLYKGRDEHLLESIVQFRKRKPDEINGNTARFDLSIPANDSLVLEFSICGEGEHRGEPQLCCDASFQSEKDLVQKLFHNWCNQNASVRTDNIPFNSVLKRNLHDFYVLRQPSPRGVGIAAGIPWFCAIFGRDCAIAASQIMAFMPDLAKDCVSLLAAYQGNRTDPFTGEMPGRIPHELRIGELARTREIPHLPYYGTIDATQLWLSLYCEYINWSGSLEFARALWPNVLLAVEWIENNMGASDGYLRYSKMHFLGLDNQGWKDSWDAVTHANGELAEPPIAICEAQAYVYSAFTELAKIANRLGEHDFATKLTAVSTDLKQRFQRDFWLDSEEYLALALDGKNQQVKTIASNAGHCLRTGILDAGKAEAVAKRLMKSDLFSGWGVRTLSSSAFAYDPKSYHNGSVWPHDNAIIADGMFKIGMTKEGHKIMQAMADVAKSQIDLRIPELFCGHERTRGSVPPKYPVSCSPQSWAAGSIFQTLQASLGIQADALENRLNIIRPSLPAWLNRLELSGLRIKDSEIDLLFTRQNGTTSWKILSNSGTVEVTDK